MGPEAAGFAVQALAAKHAVHRELRPGVGRAAGYDATCGGCGYHVCACAAKAPARKPGEFVVGDRVRVVDADKLKAFPCLVGRVNTISRVVPPKSGSGQASYEFPCEQSYDGFVDFFGRRLELVEPAPAPRATAG